MASSPVPVLLRNGERAWISCRVLIQPFELYGQRECGAHELWRASGAWREDKTPHPLDIVEGVTSGGQRFPFSAANAAHMSL